jgi:hypothetical protein
MVRTKRLTCGAAAIGALWVSGGIASAGLTDVRPAAPGEVGQEQILERLYNADFARSGSSWVSGDRGITVSRIDDASDRQLGATAPGHIDLVAAFTGYRWQYGVQDGARHTLASARQSGSGFDVSGGFDLPAGANASELFLQHANGRRYQSADATDQMVSYRVSGASSGDQTLYFWEDWARGRGSDMDFNDLVLRGSDMTGAVAAQAAAPQQTASVPLPPAVWPGVAGLVGIAALSARRRLRRPAA